MTTFYGKKQMPTHLFTVLLSETQIQSAVVVIEASFVVIIAGVVCIADVDDITVVFVVVMLKPKFGGFYHILSQSE